MWLSEAFLWGEMHFQGVLGVWGMGYGRIPHCASDGFGSLVAGGVCVVEGLGLMGNLVVVSYNSVLGSEV